MEANELLQYLINYGANLISTGAIVGIGAKMLMTFKSKVSSKVDKEELDKLVTTNAEQAKQIEALKQLNAQNNAQISELTNNVNELTKDITKVNKE